MYPDTYDKIIYELCKKHSININKIEPESIYRLTRGSTTRFIWSRRFDINTTLSCRIADNKFATYTVLNSVGISSVPYIKLPRIDTEDYTQLDESIFEICRKLLCQHKKIVIKPNNSYEGTDVYKCHSLKDVENILFNIEKKYKYLVVSPYIDAVAEYRLFFLDNTILYAYKKEVNNVICDGSSTVYELLLKNKIPLNKVMPSIISELNKIYPNNYKLPLNWKFNLSQGANCLSIDDSLLMKELVQLAISAANAINIRFATVDILVDNMGIKQVLEINAGVAMDQLIMKHPHGIEIATSIYEQALMSMFK